MCNGPCHAHNGEHAIGECGLSGGCVRGFLKPRLILLLLQKPAHGYELMEQLAEDADMPGADPGLLYRTLRQMEHEGLLRSTWDTEGQGPARRLYEVTPEGVDFLHAWAARVRQIRHRLGQFVKQYDTYFQQEEG
jgi:PadR family transcriptional regulator PadR